jgi:hypothetical protein
MTLCFGNLNFDSFLNVRLLRGIVRKNLPTWNLGGSEDHQDKKGSTFPAF